jgi:hypothetical protein
MRPDIAMGIQPGDIIYNCFMEPLVVKEIVNTALDSYPAKYFTQFTVTDARNKQHIYSCEDIYLKDLEDEDDAEKSWVGWAKDNKDFIDEFDHLTTIKEIYKVGFGNGFDHKRKLTFEEMMQK